MERNGASGIFVDAPDGPNAYLPPGADVLENVVRGNAHWGITMGTNGSVHVARNSVSRNYLYGIDVGVDLDSPPTFLEPVIVSATYDPARGATILRGQVGHARYGSTRIDVYSSSSLSVWGYPDAEEWVGHYYAGGGFELAIPRDLRGKWITATGTEITGLIFLREEGNVVAPPRYQSYDTSELSNAVRVQ